MSDLYVIATMVSAEGKADDLRSALIPATKLFLEEAGCMGYTLLEDLQQPGRFVTYERWCDKGALETHMHSSTMEALKPLLHDFLVTMTQEFFGARLIL